MTEPSEGPTYSEEFWREVLTKGDPTERRLRRFFSRIPHGPRCRMCAAPFEGVGAPVMRLLGRRPSGYNPTMCTSCFEFTTSHRGGAEIEASFLFADIRGSTTIAEGMSPAEFRGLLDRFYSTASNVVFAHDGNIDKFVGDELVALFLPNLTGDRHAELAVQAARALFAETGHGASEGPWVPLGAGVHTGLAWVGAVGDGPHVELTALGDSINTTARLAAAAGPGEILVTTAAAGAAGLDGEFERRSLELKGKEHPTEVVVLRA